MIPLKQYSNLPIFSPWDYIIKECKRSSNFIFKNVMGKCKCQTVYIGIENSFLILLPKFNFGAANLKPCFKSCEAELRIISFPNRVWE